MSPGPKGGELAAEPTSIEAPRPVEEMTEHEVEAEMVALQQERTDRFSQHQALWHKRERAAHAGLLDRVAEVDAERLQFRDECRRLAPVIGRRYELLNEALTRHFERRGVMRLANPPDLEYWAGLS